MHTHTPPPHIVVDVWKQFIIVRILIILLYLVLMQTHGTRYDNTEYIVHGSKNGLLYDLTYFGAKVCQRVLIDKLFLHSKLNYTINWVWLRWTYTPDQPWSSSPPPPSSTWACCVAPDSASSPVPPCVSAGQCITSVCPGPACTHTFASQRTLLARNIIVFICAITW